MAPGKEWPGVRAGFHQKPVKTHLEKTTQASPETETYRRGDHVVEPKDEWTVARRHMSLASLCRLNEAVGIGLTAHDGFHKPAIDIFDQAGM